LPGYNPSPYGAAGAANPLNPYNVPGLPGYNPYTPTNPLSGYNPANPYNAPGMPGYNPYQASAPHGTPYGGGYGGGGYGDPNAPTAADFGLPPLGDNSGSSGGPDMSQFMYDPSNAGALASYYDPSSQLGPWSGY